MTASLAKLKAYEAQRRDNARISFGCIALAELQFARSLPQLRV
jgi:hypothetical protein